MKKSNKKIQEWIPVKRRPLTEEEISEYGHEYSEIWDGILPDDSCTVIITYVCKNFGKAFYGVDFTEFDADDNYFDEYNDEVIAWMPLPEPYKEEECEKE